MSTSTPGARSTAARPIDLEYPDRDGKPMSDDTLQFKWIVTIKEGLEALFRDELNVLDDAEHRRAEEERADAERLALGFAS